MNMDLYKAIAATDAKAQYDACAKRLLGNKCILAHILVKAVDDFKDMSPRDVETYIEGEPYIAVVPVELGFTNTENKNRNGHDNKGKCANIGKNENNGKQLIGFNTETGEINEGIIRFDIVFYVRLPGNNEKKDVLSQIIINIEAQKSEPGGYNIMDRAVFYVSRLISSQKGRDFENSNYSDIKRVYSIWICMNMDEDCMSHVHLTKDDILGEHDWKGRLDLLNIVMIGLGKEIPEHSDQYELHRLLGALLSQNLTVNEKIDIIGNEYDIQTQNNLRKEVDAMCNLGEGIEERGIEKGTAKLILAMYKNGLSEEKIAAVTDMDISRVKEILEKEVSVLA